MKQAFCLSHNTAYMSGHCYDGVRLFQGARHVLKVTHQGAALDAASIHFRRCITRRTDGRTCWFC